MKTWTTVLVALTLIGLMPHATAHAVWEVEPNDTCQQTHDGSQPALGVGADHNHYGFVGSSDATDHWIGEAPGNTRVTITVNFGSGNEGTLSFVDANCVAVETEQTTNGDASVTVDLSSGGEYYARVTYLALSGDDPAFYDVQNFHEEIPTPPPPPPEPCQPLNDPSCVVEIDQG